MFDRCLTEFISVVGFFAQNLRSRNKIKYTMTEKIRSVLLCGPTGVGKTTVVKMLIQLMQDHHVNCAGFYTEEIRFNNGVRIGFDIVTLDGKRAILARKFPNDNVERPRLGAYHVYLKEFEALALPVLKAQPKTLLFIDEIGKMEMMSDQFKEELLKIFGATPLVATIPKSDEIDYINLLKLTKNTVTMVISKKNRLGIVDTIFERVCQMVYH